MAQYASIISTLIYFPLFIFNFSFFWPVWENYQTKKRIQALKPTPPPRLTGLFDWNYKKIWVEEFDDFGDLIRLRKLPIQGDKSDEIVQATEFEGKRWMTAGRVVFLNVGDSI